METVCFSETLVSAYESTRFHNPGEQQSHNTSLSENIMLSGATFQNHKKGINMFLILYLCLDSFHIFGNENVCEEITQAYGFQKLTYFEESSLSRNWNITRVYVGLRRRFEITT
jgi:hypothetical protein